MRMSLPTASTKLTKEQEEQVAKQQAAVLTKEKERSEVLLRQKQEKLQNERNAQAQRQQQSPTRATPIQRAQVALNEVMQTEGLRREYVVENATADLLVDHGIELARAILEDAAEVAKHRKSREIQAADLNLILVKKYNIRVPSAMVTAPRLLQHSEALGSGSGSMRHDPPKSASGKPTPVPRPAPTVRAIPQPNQQSQIQAQSQSAKQQQAIKQSKTSTSTAHAPAPAPTKPAPVYLKEEKAEKAENVVVAPTTARAAANAAAKCLLGRSKLILIFRDLDVALYCWCLV